MTVFLSILFGIVSMVLYGASIAFSKPLARRLGPAQTLFLRGLSVCILLFVTCTPTLYRMQHHSVATLLTIGLGIAGYLPVLAFTHAIRESRIGIVAPIGSAAPVITVLLSCAFLNVDVSPLEWLALAAIVAANIYVGVDFKDWRQSNFLQRASGVPFALLAATGWGFFYYFLVPSTRSLGPWLAALLSETGVTIAAGVHAAISDQQIHWSETWHPQVIRNGAMIAGGTLAFTLGVNYYDVGIVEAVSNSNAIIAILLGVALFKEHLHNKEKIAATIMIIGIAALPLTGS